jgi:hypothetical protein
MRAILALIPQARLDTLLNGGAEFHRQHHVDQCVVHLQVTDTARVISRQILLRPWRSVLDTFILRSSTT